MEKKVSVKLKIPAYKVNLETYVQLLDSIVKLMGKTKTDRILITVRVSNESYDYKSLEDFHLNIPSSILRITNIEMSVYNDNVSINYSAHSDYSMSYINVSGIDYSQCDPVVGLLREFGNRNKRWYHWIRPWMFWFPFVVLGNLPFLVLKYENRMGPLLTISYFMLVLFLSVLIWKFDKLFPQVNIVIFEKGNWLANHQTEIITGAAIITTVATVCTLIITIFK
ncbi:hypothetical protein [Leptospira weilii]|uniref:Uncharacterized protein n=1 Tax=Leptospira weilii str. UI 13098 TaxID=1088542 RepID=M6QH19_9LEPT|nr:hypothetical protein [Leptospira weilii]EMN92555.1 hypothetical protein LEP1GSC108_0430 [Leptospira weilii str. UI 13098]OMI14672.1 hypothetical protein BUQ74_20630 [Leptospira weilii serovar Heyan]